MAMVMAMVMVLACPGRGVAEIDFSTCGYRHSTEAIPLVAAALLVTPATGDGDDGARIQAAIDQVSVREPDAAGFRGAVLLAPGHFAVAGQLVIRAAGVVLRGSGDDATFVHATGTDRRALIRVEGIPDLEIRSDTPVECGEAAVPAGATVLRLKDVSHLQPGDRILVTRPSTAAWIEALGMDRPGIAWKPGTRDLRWERAVTGVDHAAQTVTLDAPITTSLEARFGGATAATFDWHGRIGQVGIENLQLVSDTAPGRDHDEDHAWSGITMNHAGNCWVRRITFRGFAGSAVALWEGTRCVTVEDCISLGPVSEIGGYRRHTFFTMGQQTLFLRCLAQHGRHDFSAGHCAAGPNAFVACEASEAIDFSGPIESWASGVLYDNVRIDGAALRFDNHWSDSQGVGWAAANCVAWQCNAAEIRCFDPPGAWNRAIGVWSRCVGDGHFEQLDEFVKPVSLFVEQLEQRLAGGSGAAAHIGPVGRAHFGATNPDYAQATAFVAASGLPAQSLRDVIASAGERHRIPVDPDNLPRIESVPVAAVGSASAVSEQHPDARLALREGRLFAGGRPLEGTCFTPLWWRGNIRPGEAPAFGHAITRFVPGRTGTGFTDDLEEVAVRLRQSGVAVVEHHHGLWYDRRRDDHLRERRANGDVVPPFYEQPFARSGEGTAWDGLSRFDLSRFNPWYWNRLRQFAGQCETHGLVLFHQHYFQHNILEAGAHWADFPWRPANNVNDTGFPEPPPYVSDKRIFQAHLFYDTGHPRRRQLHRAYIRQCLDSLAGCSNVIHSIGAEFTGPLAFVEFWIATIREWENETGNDVMVALSCTKDVQDAILADAPRAEAISVIDIRQWWFSGDGALYAPQGGKNLSPRQHARLLKPGNPSPESMRRAVREYSTRHPDKAILVNGAPVHAR